MTGAEPTTADREAHAHVSARASGLPCPAGCPVCASPSRRTALAPKVDLARYLKPRGDRR